MPNPKHKHSKSRRDKRRTSKVRIRPQSLSVCPQCHQPKLPHRVCGNCGYYAGRQAIEVE